MFYLTLIKNNKLPILLSVISSIFYFTFAYDLARTDDIRLLSLYVALFFLFYKLLQFRNYNTRFLIASAFIFRAVFIFAIPNLSQDFYRFIWDGRLLLEGLNPYLHTPASFILKGEFPVDQAQELYAGMGALNASHFTNYPPVNQLCFLIASFFAGKSIVGSVVVLRILIVAADFGTLYFGKKLLKKLKLPIHNIFLYLLNPFIIIELTGNLHFEGVMIFFLVWSLYVLHSGKWKMAGMLIGASIATKLIPLMFLPLFFGYFFKYKKKQTLSIEIEESLKTDEIARSPRPRLDNTPIISIGTKKPLPNAPLKQSRSVFSGITKLIAFYSIITTTVLLLFAPFFSSQFIDNYSKTVGLWFGDFEFNASIYYIARAVGYWFRGWNEIAIIGKILPVCVLFFILYLTFFNKNKTTKQLIISMLFAFTLYLFMSTTVHPWYLATLVFLSVFTHYKFPLIWSFIIVISYLAYANTNHSENLWLISIEYIVVYGYFIWDVFIKHKTSDKEE